MNSKTKCPITGGNPIKMKFEREKRVKKKEEHKRFFTYSTPSLIFNEMIFSRLSQAVISSTATPKEWKSTLKIMKIKFQVKHLSGIVYNTHFGVESVKKNKWKIDI